MITKKTALKEAGRFAAALDGPLGRRAMQPAIRDFLPLFRELRASGASWSQIASLLAAAGVRSGSGQPLANSVLRAMVSRAEREALVSDSEKKEAATSGQPSGRRVRVSKTTSPRLTTAAPQPHGVTQPAALGDVAERIRRASALRGQTLA
ncbi:hypothetical protein [Neoaquamicrobium sediminum]|uniref:Uncharacterized protein n=1 Tax=Neoaquamicrobium sediminum TaxID=1849104 RepID=A0ABV3WV56_9HYPH